MTLIPTEGILADFLDLLDRPGGSEIVRLAIAEGLVTDIEAHRPMIESSVAKVWTSRIEATKRSLLRTYVGKRMDGEVPEDYDVAAAQLTVIESYVSKASRHQFKESDVRRDPGGRFGVKLIKDGKPTGPPVSARLAAMNNALYSLKDPNALKSVAERDAHTTILNHIADVLSEFDAIGAKTATIAVRTKDGIRHDTISVKANAATLQNWAPGPDEYPISINVSPSEIKPHTLAAFDALSSVTNRRAAGQIAGKLPSDKGKAAATAWTKPSEPGSYERQLYNRLQVGGEALSALEPAMPGAAHVGAVAQVVGTYGPEAERVFGPGLRRTLYRYRGTERRPDPKLREDVAAIYAGETQIAVEPGAASTEQSTMFAARNKAVEYYARQLPQPNITRISVAAGRVPPSQGVIISAEGHLAAESMGNAVDHYLPFDMKNLSRLHGGQYIRTRAMGGPTAEDIYTGLMTNTRTLTVVSNSGVFTVDFDPELRGGRRYSDKAKHMIKRYEKLLDAIDAGELLQRPLSPDKKQEINQQAMAQSGGDRAIFEDRAKTLTKEAILRGTMVPDLDPQEIERQAHQVATADRADRMARGEPTSDQQYKAVMGNHIREATKKQNDEAVRVFQLNGDGYAGALQALQQEFPYFIRATRFEPINQFFAQRPYLGPAPDGVGSRVRDSGYTLPGTTDPVAALAGFHRKEMGQPKVSAAARDLPADKDGNLRGSAPKPTTEEARTTASSGGIGGTPGGTPPTAQARFGAKQGLLTVINNPAALTPFMEAGTLNLLNAITGVGVGIGVEPADSPEARIGVAAHGGLYAAAQLQEHYKENDYTKLAEKLVDPATSARYQVAINQALDGLNSDEIVVPESKKEFLRAATRKFNDLKAIISPFMAPGHRVEVKNTKPLHFDDIVAMGSKPEDFDAQKLTNRAVADHLRDHPTWGDEAYGDQVHTYQDTIAQALSANTPEEAYDAGARVSPSEFGLIKNALTSSQTYRELETTQRAWAFTKAKEVATAWAALRAGGGGDPKVEPVGFGKGRRQVVFQQRPDHPSPQRVAKARALAAS